MPTVMPLTMGDGFDNQPCPPPSTGSELLTSLGESPHSGHRFPEEEPITQLSSGQDVPAQSPASKPISFQPHAQLLGPAD